MSSTILAGMGIVFIGALGLAVSALSIMFTTYVAYSTYLWMQ